MLPSPPPPKAKPEPPPAWVTLLVCAAILGVVLAFVTVSWRAALGVTVGVLLVAAAIVGWHDRGKAQRG